MMGRREDGQGQFFYSFDLVGQGQDLAIRYGELADSTLRVKRLGNNRRIVCASPAYLRNKAISR
jgi:DNA-binding transcriptional LysR family regulator